MAGEVLSAEIQSGLTDWFQRTGIDATEVQEALAAQVLAAAGTEAAKPDHFHDLDDTTWALCQAKAQEDWFAGSKIVNAQGQALVMYHGTNAEFEMFSSGHTQDDHVPGISLTDNISEARGYGANVKQVLVRAVKPMAYPDLEDWAREKAISKGLAIDDEDFSAFDIEPQKLLTWLKEDGFDAIDYRSVSDLGYGLRVFDPEQIRLVDSHLDEDHDSEVRYHRAWHGSPHEFDAFSLNHVGSGEGARAYGWGLYFASSVDVAQWYQDKFSLSVMVMPDGNRLRPGVDVRQLYPNADPAWLTVLDDVVRHGATESALKHSVRMQYEAMRFGASGARLKKARELMKAWKLLLKAPIQFEQEQGLLYQVDVSADENDYLDWGRPLSEQSESVRENLNQDGAREVYLDALFHYDPSALRLRKMAINLDLSPSIRFPAQEELEAKIAEVEATMPASELYLTLARLFESDRGASDFLMAVGIPGIRYLDGNSRGDDDVPAYNHVIFDDKLVDIVSVQDQRDTPEFKAWFRQSAVTTPDGQPAIVFHGTVADFNAFDPSVVGGFHFGTLDQASHATSIKAGRLSPAAFAKLPEMEAGQPGRIMSVYLAIQNPKRVADARTPEGWAREIELAKAEGYDGLVYKNDFEGRAPADSWVAFSPEQIKSADLNRGTFDPGNPDIRYAMSGQPVFYSQLLKCLQEAPAKVFTTGLQVKFWLAGNAAKLGIKKDEIHWSGINDFLELKGTSKVTRDEVVALLDANGVQVEELLKGAPVTEIPVGWSLEQDRYGNWVVANERGVPVTTPQRTKESALEVVPKSASPTKYAKYTLPGGEDYRELLITLPKNEKQQTYQEWVTEGMQGEWSSKGTSQSKTLYRSKHWDGESNVLAHVRFNTRYDQEGKKVLFIEEIQSDWGQEGKRKGFDVRQAAKPLAKGEFDNFVKELRETAIEQFKVRLDGDEEAARSLADTLGHQQLAEATGRLAEYTAMSERQADQLARDGHYNFAGRLPIPSAPFVTDTKAWVSLALKRVMRYAVDNGFDKVAFVNGEQSSTRYDLSKQVDSVLVTKEPGGTYAVWADRADSDSENGRAVMLNSSFSEDKLSEVIGKGLADKAVAQLKEAQPGEQIEFSGLDLQVGDYAMRAFYDQIVPQVANDVLRKVGGGQVHPLQVDRTDYGKRGKPADWNPSYSVYGEQLGFDITDAMRAAVLAGLPLFRRGGIPGRPGMDSAQLRQSMAEAFGADFVGKMEEGGAFRLLDRESELPEVLKHPAGGVLGAYDPATKTTYFVAERIRPWLVRGMVLHEIGVHHGLRHMLGDRAKNLFQQARRLADLGNAIAVAADRKVPDDTKPWLRDEELLAYMMGDMAGHRLSVVQRAWSGVKGFLFKQGLDIDMTPADMLVMTEGCVKRCADEAHGGAKPTLWGRLTQVLKQAVSVASNPIPVVPGGIAYRQDARAVPQIETGAFKAWFGDSKVVSADGRPMMMFHGTASDTDFGEFSPYFVALGSHFGPASQANGFATQDKGIDSADEPGPRVLPVWLSIKNPVRLVDPGSDSWASDAVGQQLFEMGLISEEELERSDELEGEEYGELIVHSLEKAGYDGVVYLNRREGDIDPDVAASFDHLSDADFRVAFPEAEDSYIAFHPEQIKSAIGNYGTFDPANPDIRHRRNPLDIPVVERPTFQTWFGNSKAVDAQGAPLVLYHGSRTPQDLTAFVPGGANGASRSGDAYGVGAYFTSDPREASNPVYTGEGGAVFPVYVRGNILDLSDELSENERQVLTDFANEHLLPSDKARFDTGRRTREFTDEQEALEFFWAQQDNWQAFGDGMARAEPDVDVQEGKVLVSYTDFDAPLEIRTADEALTMLKAVGFDNVLAMGFDGIAMTREGGARWFVMHNPDGNVKSAIGNDGSYDRFTRDIRYCFAGEKAEIADRSRLAQAWELAKPLSDEERNRIQALEGRYLTWTPEEEAEYGRLSVRLDCQYFPETIRELTGWFPGYDGKWRFEIGDQDAKLLMNREQYLEASRRFRRVPDDVQESPEQVCHPSAWLSEVLDHPALFAAYPGLRHVRVSYDFSLPLLGGQRGAFNSEANSIVLSPWLDDRQVLSTLLHEVQHAIQFIEGYAIGASADYFYEQSNAFELLEEAMAELQRIRELRPDIGDAWDRFEAFRGEMAEKYGVTFFDEDMRYKEHADRELRRCMTEEERGEWSARVAAYGATLDDSEASKSFVAALGRRHSAFMDQHGRQGVVHVSPHQQYLRLAGEIEARSIQSRQGLSDEERAKRAPYESEGIPEEDVILLFESKLDALQDHAQESIRSLERRAAFVLQRDPAAYRLCIDGLVSACLRNPSLFPLVRPTPAGNVQVTREDGRWMLKHVEGGGQRVTYAAPATGQEALQAFWESAIPQSDLRFDLQGRLIPAEDQNKVAIQPSCDCPAP